MIETFLMLFLKDFVVTQTSFIYALNSLDNQAEMYLIILEYKSTESNYSIYSKIKRKAVSKKL